MSHSQAFTHMIIKWTYAPAFYSVQISENGIDYKEIMPWKQCADGEANKLWKEAFGWWKYKDRSFLELVTFPEKINGKSIRILMRNPLFFFFGIYDIKLLQKKTDVLIKTSIDNEDFCLMRGSFPKDSVLVCSCFDLISFSNDDELFTITKNFKIQSISSEKKCLKYHEKQDKLSFSSCDSNSKQNKWQFQPNKSFIALENNNKKCLKAGNVIILQMNDVFISATSAMNDDNHKPLNSFIDNSALFWASSPGDRNVRYIVRFEESLIKQIKIQWKYKPKEFIIEVFLNGFFWKKVFSDKNNENFETFVDINDYITGIKVILLESESLFNEKIVFGIENIKIITGFRKVELFNCEENENDQGIQWKTEDIDPSLSSRNLIKNLKFEQNSLYHSSEKIEKIAEDLKGLQEPLKDFRETANKIKQKIKKILNFYTDFFERVTSFKEKYFKIQVIAIKL